MPNCPKHNVPGSNPTGVGTIVNYHCPGGPNPQNPKKTDPPHTFKAELEVARRPEEKTFERGYDRDEG